MILGLDIGNTNIEIGVLSEKKNDLTVKASARFFTRNSLTSDELGFFILAFLDYHRIKKSSIKKAIYSSVVPPLNWSINKMCGDYFTKEIIEVGSNTEMGIKNCYKNPGEVGSDRLVNAACVHHLYKKNSIIVDMGTATTFCAVTKEGRYLGGAIMPGLMTSAEALTSKAAKLPAINIGRRTAILAENTVEAIEAGVYFSNLYSIRGIIEKLAGEAGFEDFIKAGTGGYMQIFKKEIHFDYLDSSLTLKGLKIIADMNAG